MNTYIPKVVDLSTNPDNRWGIEKKRKEAAEIYNRSQIQDPYERRAPIGYREALPLGLAAALAKLLGVSDADLGAGFQGFMGAREDAEERRYQNHMANQARRQQELVGQARMKELEIDELDERLARRDAKIAQAKADARSQSIINAYMKMDRPRRTSFILDQLGDGNPIVSAMLEKMSPDQLQSFLDGDDEVLPAPARRMTADEQQLHGFSRGLNQKQASMLEQGVSLFDPEFQAEFAQKFGSYLRLKKAPTSDEVARLLKLIREQVEALTMRAFYDDEARNKQELLISLAQSLPLREAPVLSPPRAEPPIKGQIPPVRVVPR